MSWGQPFGCVLSPSELILRFGSSGVWDLSEPLGREGHTTGLISLGSGLCAPSVDWLPQRAGYFYFIFIVCLPMRVDVFVCEQMCGCVHVYTDA